MPGNFLTVSALLYTTFPIPEIDIEDIPPGVYPASIAPFLSFLLEDAGICPVARIPSFVPLPSKSI